MLTLSKRNESDIVRLYGVRLWTLRMVADKYGTDHHRIRRVLEVHGIEITRRKTLRPYTDEHRRKVGEASKGRTCFWKGKKMPKVSLYKNMAAHLRHNVTSKWLSQFDDIEKLKVLNNITTKRSQSRNNFTTEEYKQFILKFYNDAQFNAIYKRWVASGRKKYFKPSVDHIQPVSMGGGYGLENLQFLTWFENRAKNNMTQEEWDDLKNHIGEYFV